MVRTFGIALLWLVALTPAVWGDEISPEAIKQVIKQWRPLPGETFEVAGRPAFLIQPPKAAKGNPWVVYAPTFQGSLPAEKDEGWMLATFSSRASPSPASMSVSHTAVQTAGQLSLPCTTN